MNNDINDPFVKASKQKLRFRFRSPNAASGYLTVEDLWDLQLKDLDRMACDVNEELGGGESRSFLANPGRAVTQETKDNELRLEILKAVIKIREDENRRRREEAEKRWHREFLTNLKEKKKFEELERLSVEEIDEQLRSLNDDDVQTEAATAASEV